MAYDWQAELRKHLVLPTSDLNKGGQFSIRAGGTIVLRKNSNTVNFHGDAEYNIDLIEIFTLRSAQASGGVSITNKNPTNNDNSFAFYSAAICDFHKISHHYKPPHNQKLQFQVLKERVIGYLEEKYAEQPRPDISKKPPAKTGGALNYDWKAELRQHLVRPNSNLDAGGTFSIRSGGSITISKDSSKIAYHGNAAYDIDVLEVFVLRDANPEKVVSLTDKSLVANFAYYNAAICDFYGLMHDFKPKNYQTEDYRDAWERIIAYLEAKYAEQPRPYVLAASKHDHIENRFIINRARPIVTATFYTFAVIWLGVAVMGHPIDGFLTLAFFFGLLLFVLWSIAKLRALPTRLQLRKRLARFVMKCAGGPSSPPH